MSYKYIEVNVINTNIKLPVRESCDGGSYVLLQALNRYSDTESEIAQLLARHSNETHALRERLRRSQERLRASERGQREADERLQRSEQELQKLRKLADDQRLGEREELSRRLEASQQRVQDNERKMKVRLWVSV